MSAYRASRGRSHGAALVSLGVEPPLGVAGVDAPDALDRRAVSLRWFIGTVLTGVTGAVLLGGACYSTLQRGAEAVQAFRIASAQARTDDRISNGARKGDRLSPEQETAAARQIIRVSSTTKHGDREVVRMRPFVKISAPLMRAPSDFASRVPVFDPMKTLAAANRDRAAPDRDEGEGDLSFTVSDLAARKIAPDEGPTVQPVDVRARVREAAAFEVATRMEPAPSLTASAESALAYATGQPNAGVLDIRPSVRNMTLVEKSAAGVAPGASAPGESAVVVTTGGPLATALERDAGVSAEDARAVADRFAGRDGYGVASVMPGQRIKVLMGRVSGPASGALQPVRVSLYDADGGHVGSVAMSDIGQYVAVADAEDFADEPSAEDIADEVERPGVPGRMRLYNGLYEAALKNLVPPKIIDEMVRIVSYDVDFNRPVGSGDGFEVFYSDPNEAGGDGEVAYMALKLAGEQRRFYRFETDDDGFVDFYDEAGKSAKKFLMRKPMNGGVMRSGFGFRRHPILGYAKMHTGVDWAAPTGTPIVASGNGTVEKAGWANGYGRQVVLKHSNGYETTYNHMSGIGRGVTPGATIRQGQIVGYVGSTGLSTGAHLHYEVMINGRFVNPMTIKLPRGRELDGSEFAKFKQERDRVEGLLGRGPATAQNGAPGAGGG
ncbi:M23 family metallopeptidase [Methylopila sp. M107]|uniref:M23 family metallopeptidase n=1 Tax=Methylopila sp. M107 TaxID=1101190 RepID=UPI00036111FB|nr:M23 family metallopeptidase [Methylopila sp. M107]